MKDGLRDERGLSSLAVAADWQVWWREWGPRIAKEHGKQGWILFLLDANERITEVTMLISRILRNKPEWDTRGWTQAEWENVEAQATIAESWYLEHAPSPMRDAPEWARFLFQAMGGNFAVLSRLGRELRAVQEQGYLVATIERNAPGGLGIGGDAAEILYQEAD